MAGRRSKKRDATTDAILASLRAGATRVAAAEAAGVHRNTLRRWLDEDDALRCAVEKAEAECEEEAVSVVKTAWRNGTWQAAAWWLERRRRDDYAQKSVTQLQGDEEQPVSITLVRG